MPGSDVLDLISGADYLLTNEYERSLLETKAGLTGEQVLDMRDFAIPSPTVLMLRIYPDVRVRLQVEAEPEDAP